ncbi:MAG: phosphoribosylamine--glycine ligase [Desulfitibacter sp. BRH_c19]|nr:MAG: phosphoribosylamine--glycine ligase [Desulfitibacter sp. BRH_c19]
MNVLVIGGGGREHALVWKLSESSGVDEIYCVPGNGGILNLAKCIDIDVLDFNALIDFAKNNKIELTIVGPEVPLTEGIVDAFEEAGLAIFGPSKKAAELEGSKAFAKDFMKKYAIPTAEYMKFVSAIEAKEYIKKIGAPCVVKADGLAAGKGVVVAITEDEAIRAVDEIMEDRRFGDAGQQIVVEEFLDGEEVSLLALTDGKTVVPMLPAQDHKRVFDNDQGPNTGGMGAYAPAPICDAAMLEWVQQNILKPTVEGMKNEGRLFKGVLYAGLMITKKGPKVLEFNVRFGDPETQPILLLLESDLVEVCSSVINGTLDKDILKWHQGYAVCVVAASGGYPNDYEKGKPIAIGEIPEFTKIFHAGTIISKNNQLVTSGGRVLGVTSKGDNLDEAIKNVYESIKKVNFADMHFRKDIGCKALRL